MKLMSRTPRFSAAGLLCLGLFCQPARGDNQKDLEHQLRPIYENKLLALRSPYFGRSLVFDSSGAILNSAVAGPWSTCGLLQAKKVRMIAEGIQIDAKRVILVLRPGETGDPTAKAILEAAPVATEDDVRLRIQVAPLDVGHVNSALSHIFQGGSLLERVSAYWKPVESDVSTPGPSTPRVTGMLEGNRPVYTGLMGVQAPKLIYAPDPEYTEAARSAKLQGVAVLQAVVNEDGFPEMLEVLRGLEKGLDIQAILAVSRWRFKPAEKDGKPLAVVINVETTFKLR